jgi:hypothetical protein
VKCFWVCLEKVELVGVATIPWNFEEKSAASWSKKWR